MESLWERLSNGAESVVDNIKVSVSETYQDVTGFIKSEISDVGNVALGGVEKVFDSLGKYFLIGIGALIILVYVAGKSGAVKIRSVL